MTTADATEQQIQEQMSMVSPASPKDLQTVEVGLNGVPVVLADAAGLLPRAGGLYAWWAAPDVFADLPGTANGSDPGMRLLYLGIATNLHSRIVRNHMARSGSSTLRRTMAGLLLPTERYQTTWTDRVILVPADEQRLTRWMHTNVRLTWFACEEPRQYEISLIAKLRPPLNVEGAPEGDARDRARDAKAAFAASAGPRQPGQ